MTTTEVRALIEGLRSTVRALSNADPALKAELYAELGIELVYHSDGRVLVESRPAVYSERVGGGTRARGPQHHGLDVEYGASDLRLAPS